MKTLSRFPRPNCASIDSSKRPFVRHYIIDMVAHALRCSVITEHDCSNAIALDVHFSELVSRRSQKEIGICERTIDHTNAISQTATSFVWDLALRHV